MAVLPSSFALGYSDTGAYLNCIDGGYLEYSIGVTDPRAKFTLEPAKSDQRLVHIRSKENKYWVRSSSAGLWIFGTAKEPVENMSAWNCTLFMPMAYNDRVIFVHVQTGSQVRNSVNPKYRLTINTDDPELAISRVVDYASVVILPRTVAFRGHNGKFLRAHYQSWNNANHLQLAHDDIGSEWVPQEVFPNNHGDVSIKNTYFKNFWHSPSWILVDTDEYHTNATLFRPVRIDKNVIALRALSNNQYLKRYQYDYLATDGPNITNEARLEVYEPVIKRTVKTLQFRLREARIYDKYERVMAVSQEHSNVSGVPNTVSLSAKYIKSKTRVWNRSFTVGVGVKMTFETKIPFIADAEIEFSAQMTTETQWGGSETDAEEATATVTMVVPPRKKAQLVVFGTEARSDIPFSYLQIDTLTNGQTVTHSLHDGVFTGNNNYGFKSETKMEDLPRALWY